MGGPSGLCLLGLFPHLAVMVVVFGWGRVLAVWKDAIINDNGKVTAARVCPFDTSNAGNGTSCIACPSGTTTQAAETKQTSDCCKYQVVLSRLCLVMYEAVPCMCFVFAIPGSSIIVMSRFVPPMEWAIAREPSGLTALGAPSRSHAHTPYANLSPITI